MHNNYPNPQEAPGWGPPPQPGYGGAPSWEQPAAGAYPAWGAPNSQPAYGGASSWEQPTAWESEGTQNYNAAPAPWGGNVNPTSGYTGDYNTAPAPWGSESAQAYTSGYNAAPNSQTGYGSAPNYGTAPSWEQPVGGGYSGWATPDSQSGYGGGFGSSLERYEAGSVEPVFGATVDPALSQNAMLRSAAEGARRAGESARGVWNRLPEPAQNVTIAAARGALGELAGQYTKVNGNGETKVKKTAVARALMNPTGAARRAAVGAVRGARREGVAAVRQEAQQRIPGYNVAEAGYNMYRQLH